MNAHPPPAWAASIPFQAPVWAAALLVIGACAGPREPPPQPDGRGQAAPNAGEELLKLPWTREFLAAAVLVAADVRIEGPRGLLQHVVTRPAPDEHEVSVKTVPEGFLQSVRLRDGASAEIRAQLDNLVISATRSLTVLERPGPVHVVVLASGEVYHRQIASGAELRAATLRLEGRVER